LIEAGVSDRGSPAVPGVADAGETVAGASGRAVLVEELLTLISGLGYNVTRNRTRQPGIDRL
jgi:hypothetical protein